MKSLISGTLILLALYAQASCAQDGSQLIIINSQQQYFNMQVITIQPTLLIAIQANYSVVLYSQKNLHKSYQLVNIQHQYTNESNGLGIHHQVNNWMQTQVVVKTQQYQHKSSQLESSLSVAVQF